MAVPGGMPMKLASGLRWGIWVWCGLACGGFFISNGMAQTAAQPNRQVAITIDDLPAGSAGGMSAATITEMTSKLMAALRERKVPAVGFVNEKKLYKIGEVDARIKALGMWVESGFELGNHTYSHFSLNKVGLKAWEDDVIQGESVTRILLSQHNMQLRYFRHPYLDTGRDLETRRQAEAFLVARGYRIAPVTVDAWDWMYGGVYEDAKKRGDTAPSRSSSRAIFRIPTRCLRTRNSCRRNWWGMSRNRFCFCMPMNSKATISVSWLR